MNIHVFVAEQDTGTRGDQRALGTRAYASLGPAIVEDVGSVTTLPGF